MIELNEMSYSLLKKRSVPVRNVSYVSFNLKNCSCCQKLEDRIHRVVSSITRIDSNITDYIIRRVINVK